MLNTVELPSQNDFFPAFSITLFGILKTIDTLNSVPTHEFEVGVTV